MTDRRDHNPTRVQQAFAEAIALPTLSRAPFLARLRAESPALADEVESLLGYHARADARESDPTVSLPATMIGKVVAGCRIEQLVGYGGMSAVYAASQEFPRRRVAVKIVRRERLGASARRRLRVEAEALARLAHPNIARVFSAGTQRLGDRDEEPDESPYIVMELIEGAVPLTRWANDRGLDARARIDLAATIADAVEYAHRAGVIHRDLKPGNIIVGADGTPKIIDFGIAAVRDSTVTAATDGPMGTLAYMSPEQARGGAVDTRSDIWGLGALLYDLLAGRPPFDIGDASVAAHIDRLLHDTPLPIAGPAATAHGAAFVESVPPSTDAVLRKALANEPDRRYRSASELADELRRLVAGEPLLARPDSEWDAVVRLARRNRAPLLAAGGVFATVTAALVVSVGLLRSERAAHARAQWSSYVASISAASSMLERGDASAAHEMLAGAPEEHRGWEWNALTRLSSQTKWAIQYTRGHQVYDVDWTPDGTRIVAAASGWAVAIDRATRREVWRVDSPTLEPTWRVRAMADGHVVVRMLSHDFMRIAPDGTVVAYATNGSATDLATDAARTRLFANDVGGAQELDPVTLGVIRRIPADPPMAAYPRAIAASPDASFLVAGDVDGVVTCLATDGGATRWTWRTRQRAVEIRATAVSPDGTRVAAACGEGIVVLDARDGSVVWHQTDNTRNYRACVFTPDGREVIASNWAESADRFDAATGGLIATIVGAYSQVWDSAVSPDGREIAAGTFAARIEVFDAHSSSELDAYPLDGSAVQSIATADRTYAVTAAGALFAIDARGEVARVPLDRPANWVCALPGGTLAIAHDEGVAWISAADGRVLREQRFGSRVARVGTIRDGATLLARLDDESLVAVDSAHTATVRGELWRIGGFKANSHIAVETASPEELFLPRGLGGEQTVLDLATMTEDAKLPAAEYAAMGERSPDRTHLAIASLARAGEVTIADARTFAIEHEFPNHRGPARVVRWSPDGTRLASASSDGTVRIWHVARRTEILTAWRGQARDLAWDRDATLWIACDDGKVRAMRATPRQ